jgi:hypothetical protein
VDGGVHIEEALRRAGGLEALHLALSSSHGLMGILSTVVCPQPLLMAAGQAKMPERGAVGRQFVGGQQLGCKAVFAEQLAHQP